MKFKVAFDLMVFLVKAVTNKALSDKSIIIHTLQLYQMQELNYRLSCNCCRFTLPFLRYLLIIILSEYWKLYD